MTQRTVTRGVASVLEEQTRNMLWRGYDDAGEHPQCMLPVRMRVPPLTVAY